MRSMRLAPSRARFARPLYALLLAVTMTVALLGGRPAPASAATPIALGAFIPGAPGDPARIDQFAALVGAHPWIVMWYQAWGNAGARDFDRAKLDAVAARGAMPLVTWEPWDHSAGVNQPRYALRTIVAGNHDAYIRKWARGAAAWGKPMYLRFAHEMNGTWYPWSPGVNGNTRSEYVAAWRRVHTLFKEAGATNARWVWAPNVLCPGTCTRFEDLYPGDAYVDLLGLDGYNWGASQAWSSWTSLADVFGPSYDALAAVSARPIALTETASTELGGDKAASIRQGLLTELPARFPRVRAVVWFDENKETDWRVNSSLASLAAFREAATSPLYQGRLP
jgi:beta-mannanase